MNKEEQKKWKQLKKLRKDFGLTMEASLMVVGKLTRAVINSNKNIEKLAKALKKDSND